MDRKQAWSHYFATGDREPLIKAYWKSIEYIAQDRYRPQKEDMFQVGMMGLLKAIDKVDRNRVKSLDAWVFLNVRGMMFNARQVKPSLSLDTVIGDDEGITYVDRLSIEDEYDTGLLDSLSPREALILKMIHVFNYQRTEVAGILDISSMRVGQLERNALKKLRSGPKPKKIKKSPPPKSEKPKGKQPPKPCSKCGTLANPLRRGQCQTCYMQAWHIRRKERIRTSIPSL